MRSLRRKNLEQGTVSTPKELRALAKIDQPGSAATLNVVQVNMVLALISTY